MLHGWAAGNDPAATLRLETIEDPGIAAGTAVMTMGGAIPVEHLCPGSRIVTRSGMRVLRSVGMRMLSGAAIRIGPGVLGIARPEAPVTLARGQKLRIADCRAHLLYGTDEAHVPASRLIDGDHVAQTAVCRLPMFTLRFDSDEVIYAGGLELVSGAPAAVAA